MKKYIAMLVVAVATTSYSNAQVILPTYGGDALRFSQTNYGSSARFKGMGNAQIGVGGDISSLGGNPAGLGLFTRSEFVFTPEFNGTNINSNYLNTNTSSNKSQINLNQLGVVFHMPTYRAKGQDTQKGVVSAVVGIGYNRNNDYGLEANFSGINNTSSVYNMFYEENAGTLGNTQFGNVMRSGAVSEFNVAGAINISNQIYIGASLGLVNLNLTNDISLNETGNVENYKVDYFQNQDTKGSGVNARLGIIFRPVSELRLGVNLQTPTWFTIDDSYSVSSTDKAILDAETYDFSYNLRTPLKGSFGASYIIASRALLSADVDFVDYSTIRFSSRNGGDMSTINQNNNEVKTNYKSAVNYRVGGEVKVSDLFSLRAGYGINGSAYKDDSDNYFQTQFYSGGVGYRNKNYYFDLAYQRVQTHSTFSPYLLDDFKEPVADAKNNKNNVFLTFGIRF
jgi:Outer membrane protein transport protein (OMPP1/FadL/TodX)